jgi:hypothetical protein
MSRLVRQLLVASLLTLYGSVSLCGPGLHALLHPSCSERDEDRRDDRKSEHLTDGCSTDDCPICHQAVPGQQPPEAASPTHQALVQSRTPAVRQVATDRERYSSSHPRAPPPARIA